MTIKMVRDAIRDIAAVLVAAGVKTQSKDLASLDAALEGSDHKSVSEFFAELQQRLAQPKAAGRRSPEAADKSHDDEAQCVRDRRSIHRRWIPAQAPGTQQR